MIAHRKVNIHTLHKAFHIPYEGLFDNEGEDPEPEPPSKFQS